MVPTRSVVTSLVTTNFARSPGAAARGAAATSRRTGPRSPPRAGRNCRSSTCRACERGGSPPPTASRRRSSGAAPEGSGACGQTPAARAPPSAGSASIRSRVRRRITAAVINIDDLELPLALKRSVDLREERGRIFSASLRTGMMTESCT